MITRTDDILNDISAYCEPENLMGSLANISALLKEQAKDVNWLGFYLFDGHQLRLGPFQGLPACTQIALGKGVCGTSAQQRQTLVVPDVDQFPGHIVCDSVSRSEIVVPMIKNGQLVGVLDVDSPLLNHFSSQDQLFYETAVQIILKHLNFGRDL